MCMLGYNIARLGWHNIMYIIMQLAIDSYSDHMVQLNYMKIASTQLVYIVYS